MDLKQAANPWTSFDIADYERHMSHENVRQLQMLSQLFKSQYADHRPKKLLYLGVCSGNGLEHIDHLESLRESLPHDGYFSLIRRNTERVKALSSRSCSQLLNRLHFRMGVVDAASWLAPDRQDITPLSCDPTCEFEGRPCLEQW